MVVRSGQGLKEGGFWGKGAPYVLAKCGKYQQRGRSDAGGGKNPVWNEGFNFSITTEQAIVFEVRQHHAAALLAIYSSCSRWQRGRGRSTHQASPPALTGLFFNAPLITGLPRACTLQGFAPGICGGVPASGAWCSLLPVRMPRRILRHAHAAERCMHRWSMLSASHSMASSGALAATLHALMHAACAD